MMWKKTLSLALGALVVCASNFSTPTFAQSSSEVSAPTTAQIEAAIARLRDEFRADRRASGDRVVITDTSRREFNALTFPQSQAARRNNLSAGAKIGIGVGIAAAIAIIIAVALSGDDNNNEAPFDPRCGGIRAPCP